MKIEIDFNKKEIVLLEPVTISEISSRFKELNLEDFKIVSKHTIQLTEPKDNPFIKSGGTLGNDYYESGNTMTNNFGKTVKIEMFDPAKDAKIEYIGKQ